MSLLSLKFLNLTEENKKNNNFAEANGIIVDKFNRTIAEHFYHPNKITLVEKVGEKFSVSYYDVENFDYRIIRDKYNLTHAIFPAGIKRIRTNTFTNCSNLSNIFLPNSLESIGNNCFSHCSSLVEFSCPKNLNSIQKNAFSNCDNLKFFKTNDNLREILSKSFEHCFSLEKINLPNSVTKIGDEAFAYCTNLKELTLPKTLTDISRGCFRFCSSLNNVNLPDGLVNIKSRSFESCSNLLSLKIPQSVKTIEALAFCNCSSLQTAILPDNLEILEESIFENCYELKQIELPKNVKTIKSRSFFSTSLTNVTFPQTLKRIESEAFANCRLKALEIPENIEYIGKEAFIVNSCLNNIIICGNTEFDFGCFDNKNLKYIAYKNGKKILCTKLPNDYDCYLQLPEDKNKLTLLNTFANFDYQTNVKLLDLYNATGIIFTYKFIKDLIKSNKFDEVLENSKSIKFYSKIYNYAVNNKTSLKQLYNLEKFCTILGLFEKPGMYHTINGNQYRYDFATCAYNFLYHNLISNTYKKDFLNYLEGLNFREFNSHLAKFLMQKTQRKKSISEKNDYSIEPISNFNKILINLKTNENFLVKICNNFELLQQFNQKNKGSHKTLAPCVDSYKNLLQEVSYNNVTEETKALAKLLSQISASQEIFDISAELYYCLKNKNYSHHILNTSLSNSIHYEEINKDFTYEWLDKYDLNNLILGLKTSSCASITNNFGNGIVKANYLYQNIQNLVIKDSSNNIIAKATFYLNDEQGYGIFNTFMMYNEISPSFKPYIFDCFMRGVKDFAQTFNAEHPDKPIIQINMGKSRNKLDEEFNNHYPLSDIMLNSIDFSSYLNLKSYGLINDWELNQYVIWTILEEGTQMYTQKEKTIEAERSIV